MQTFAFLNTKGGVGKSTTAIGVASCWKRSGHRVGVLDCDKNGSASAWLGEWGGLDSTPAPVDLLDTVIAAAADQYDLLVVDTPPNLTDEIRTVAAAVDFVVIPTAPTRIELQQLQATIAILVEVGARWVVAPVKVRMSTTAGRMIRETFESFDIPVTRSIVPLSEAVAQSFGVEPPPLSYVALAEELLELASVGAR